MKRGFTLIELLVVVLIIGILSGVALPQYEKAVMKSRYSNLMATVNALGTAEELYYMANGQYTNGFEALDIAPRNLIYNSPNHKYRYCPRRVYFIGR